MTYYRRDLLIDGDAVICDPCGDTHWPQDATGGNVDARTEERRATGADWCWDRLYSSSPLPCQVCGGLVR